MATPPAASPATDLDELSLSVALLDLPRSSDAEPPTPPPEPKGWRRPRPDGRRGAFAPLASATAAILVAAMVVVGTRGLQPPLREGEARLVPDGRVEVALGGERFAVSRGPVVLHAGDRARVLEGNATLELEGGTTAELRDGTHVMVNGSRRPPLSLEQGSLLVEAAEPTDVEAGSTRVTVDGGVAKLARGRSLLAGSFDGNLVLSAATGAQLVVPQYRQATVIASGLFPERVEPLALRVDDEWDVRHLNQVMVLNRQLEALGRGFEAQLPPGTVLGPDLFSSLVPGVPTQAIPPELLADRPAGESLIGLIVSAQSDGGFANNLGSVFSFRRDGASWGLVVADRQLRPEPVLQALAEAVNRTTPRRPAPSPAGPVGSPPLASLPQPPVPTPAGAERPASSSPGPSQPAPVTPTPTTVAPAPSGAAPTTPRTEPPAPPATVTPVTLPGILPDPVGEEGKVLDVGPTGTGLDPVVDTVENLLDGLLDNLLGLVFLGFVATPRRRA